MICSFVIKVFLNSQKTNYAKVSLILLRILQKV